MVAISTHGISKRFPGVQALREVSVEIEEGTCHALMGENGAGKSTLGKIIAGVYTPDSGTVSVFGQPCSFKSPADAFAAGVGIVHQELLFCENLSVAENLCLGAMPHKGPFVDSVAMVERASEWLEPFGLKIDPRQLVGELSIGQQQMVQIAGAIGQGARVLIFDEPTSSLSHGETLRLFDLIHQLLAKGITCIYVSHRMSEIFSLCSSVSVLRDGEHVFSGPLAGMTQAELVSKMIGRELETTTSSVPPPTGEGGLTVSHLTGSRFKDVSFDVRPGEIVGLAGLVGAGRTEVARAIFGLDSGASGQVAVDGTAVELGSQHAALNAGIGLIPEDRKREGLLMNLNVRENTSLAILPKLGAFAGLLKSSEERRISTQWKDSLRTKAPTLETPVLGLSGGNQQKVVLSKWLAAECKVLILDEPTRGVDVGAKAEIHDVIRRLAAEGRTILVISSELPELLAISHRILVMSHGHLAGEIPAAGATEDRVMELMTYEHATV